MKGTHRLLFYCRCATCGQVDKQACLFSRRSFSNANPATPTRLRFTLISKDGEIPDTRERPPYRHHEHRGPFHSHRRPRTEAGFAFFELYPDYDLLRRYHYATGFPIDNLIEELKKLNRRIDDRHYEVGITFFLHQRLEGFGMVEQWDTGWSAARRRGERLRALGTELAVGDATAPDTLGPAVRGCSGIFSALGAGPGGFGGRRVPGQPQPALGGALGGGRAFRVQLGPHGGPPPGP